LAQAVLVRYVPEVDSLEFEEVLELRVRCRAELESFRGGLMEIAVQVDLTKSIEDQRLQIEDMISSKIDPALRTLEASLRSARLDILKKLSPSWDALAKAAIPFTVSAAVGASLNLQAALGVAGAISIIAAPFVEAAVERKKLLNASQWSILLELQRLTNSKRD
jgi:hypothetical protein